MLLVVLLLAGLLLALPVGALVTSRIVKAVIAGVVVAGWVLYTVYAERVASCPAVGECNRGLGPLYLGFLAAGMVGGIVAGTLLRAAFSRDGKRTTT